MALRNLIEQTRHSEAATRRAAVRQLAAFPQPESIATLVQCLADPSRSVSDSAVHALLEIGSVNAGQAVIPLLTHEDLSFRSMALAVLTGLGAAAGPILTPLLESPDRELRKSAAEVLGESGWTEAGPALVARLDDPDPVVRSAAAGALAALAYHAALPALFARCRTEAEEWVLFPLCEAVCRLGTQEQVAELLAAQAPGSLVYDLLQAELAQRGHGEA